MSTLQVQDTPSGAQCPPWLSNWAPPLSLYSLPIPNLLRISTLLFGKKLFLHAIGRTLHKTDVQQIIIVTKDNRSKNKLWSKTFFQYPPPHPHWTPKVSKETFGLSVGETGKGYCPSRSKIVKIPFSSIWKIHFPNPEKHGVSVSTSTLSAHSVKSIQEPSHMPSQKPLHSCLTFPSESKDTFCLQKEVEWNEDDHQSP